MKKIICKRCGITKEMKSPKAIFCGNFCCQKHNTAQRRTEGRLTPRRRYNHAVYFRSTLKPASPRWEKAPTYEKTCVYCGKLFFTKSLAARYCMARCASMLSTKLTRVFVNDYKMERGCVDCGYKNHPAALELDHVRGKKVRHVSLMSSLPLVKEELKKCVVRCSNCHRIKTWEEKGYGSYYKTMLENVKKEKEPKPT